MPLTNAEKQARWRAKRNHLAKRKQDRDLLLLLGIDPSGLSAADIAEGIEAARRISQCDRVPGAGKRRPQAIADWQAFVERVTERN